MNLNAANIVLYRRDPFGSPKDADAAKNFNRQPLFSCSKDDPAARAKINAHVQNAYQNAIRSGNPLPELEVVLEERSANEGGVQTAAKFTVLDMDTLQPTGKSAATLTEIV